MESSPDSRAFPCGSNHGPWSEQGVDVMTEKSRWVFALSLVTALLLSAGFAVAQAQTAGSPAVKPTKWSDPDTWPNHKVPVAGDKPTIGRDKEVILDVSPPPLAGVQRSRQPQSRARLSSALAGVQP